MKRRSLFKLLFSAPLAAIGIKKDKPKEGTLGWFLENGPNPKYITIDNYPGIKNFNPNLIGGEDKLRNHLEDQMMAKLQKERESHLIYDCGTWSSYGAVHK